MRGEKGITLIALIITIIVMLILVAVSVTAAVQSGLFTTAGNAVRETKAAQNSENNLASGNVRYEAAGNNDVSINAIVNHAINGGTF